MHKRFLKKLLFFTLACCLLLGAGLAITYSLFHTKTMQQAVANKLSSYIHKTTEGKVLLEGLKLDFPQQVFVKKCTVALPGETLVGTELKVKISLWQLLFSQLRLSSLKAHSLTLTPKASSEQPPNASSQPPSWPSIPFALSINAFSIDNLNLPQASVSCSGSAQVKPFGGSILLQTKVESEQLGVAYLKIFGQAKTEEIFLDSKWTVSPLLIPSLHDTTLSLSASSSWKTLLGPITKKATPAAKVKLVANSQIKDQTKAIISPLQLQAELHLLSNGLVDIRKIEGKTAYGQAQMQARIQVQETQGSLIHGLTHSNLRFSGSSLAQLTKDILPVKVKPIQCLFQGVLQERELASSLSLATSVDQLPIEIQSSLNWDRAQAVSLSDLEIHASDSQVTGALTLDYGKNDVMGTLEGALRNFSFAPFGVPASFANLDFELSFSEGEQLDFLFSAHNMNSSLYGNLFQGTLTGSTIHYLSTPQLLAKLEADNYLFKGYTLRSIEANISSSKDSFPFQVSLKGAESFPLELNCEGAIARSGDQFSTDYLQGRLFGLPLSLSNNLSITKQDQAIQLAPIELVLGQGSCQLEGTFLPNHSLQGKFLASQLPIKPFQPLLGLNFIEGSLSGECKLSASQEDLDGTCAFTIHRLFFHPEMQNQDSPFLGEVKGAITNNSLSLSGSIHGGSDNFAKFTTELPIDYTLSPHPSLQIKQQAPLLGQVEAMGDISPLAKSFLTEKDILTGNWEANFSLDGSIDSPNIQGSAVFKNGRYDNLYTGSKLQDIYLKVAANNHLLTIEKGLAKTGSEGTLNITGSLSLDKEQKYPLDLQLDLQKSPILRISEIFALASGKLQLQGPILHPTLSGTVIADELKITIPDKVSDSLPLLPVTYVYPQMAPSDMRERQAEPYPLGLDVRIKLNKHSYLEGRGLKSTWDGELHVEGSLQAPAVTGSLLLTKGEFSFASTVFEITEGKVFLHKNTESLGSLYVRGETSVEDIAIYATLQGDLLSPSLTFSSGNALPETEILSLILFGSSAENITPFQALQITQAIAQLSGRSSNFDLVGRLGKNIGLDQLSFSTIDGDPSNLEVEIGKYLTEDIYLTLVKSLGASTNYISLGLKLYNKFRLGVERIEQNETQTIKNRIQAGWQHSY